MSDPKPGHPRAPMVVAAGLGVAAWAGQWLSTGPVGFPVLAVTAGLAFVILASGLPRRAALLTALGMAETLGDVLTPSSLPWLTHMIRAASLAAAAVAAGALAARFWSRLRRPEANGWDPTEVRNVVMAAALVIAPGMACGGAVVSRFSPHPAALHEVWIQWWLASFLGTLVVAPPMLALLRSPPARWPFRHFIAESVATAVIIPIVCWVLARAAHATETAAGLALWVPFALSVAAGGRLETLGASLATLAVTVVTVRFVGPEVEPLGASVHTTLGLQLYGVGLQAIGLMVAGISRERRAARETSLRTENLLKGMLENTPAAVFIKDTAGRYLLVNRTYARLLGREPEDILGRTDAAMLPPERHAAMAAFDQQVLATGSSFEVEEDRAGLEGPRAWIALRFPLRNGDDPPHALGGILTDITQRRRAETELLDRERLLRRILDASPQVVYVLDLAESRILYLSRRAHEYLGAHPEEALAESQTGAAQAAAAGLAEIPAGAAGSWVGADDQEIRTREYRLRDANGSWRWFLEHSAVFQRSAGGQVRQIIGVLQDITPHKQAQLALLDQAQLSVTEAAISRLFTLDLPLERMLAEALKTIVQRLDLHHASLWRAGAASTPSLSAGEPETPPDTVWIRTVLESGQAAECGTYAAAPLPPDHQPAGLLVVERRPTSPQPILGSLESLAARLGSNIEHRRAEMEIRRLNVELEQRVHDRTVELNRRVADAERLNRGMVNLLEDLQAAQRQAELSSKRLAAANAQLDHANRELEAFSYSVSHDLRAPLRNVAGFVDLLIRSNEALEPRTRHYLQVITQETNRMGQLITDLLGFSRIARAEMSRELVNMNRLASQAWESLAGERQDRDIRWTLDPLPEVRGDSSLLALVWDNLLANAIKYSRPRTPAEIQVGSTSNGDPADHVVFFVRDNGVGFDMKYADKLFGVFQRLHSSSEFEGTGIGLANVQRIIQRHGGRVWAEARKNEGATFFFSLPLQPK